LHPSSEDVSKHLQDLQIAEVSHWAWARFCIGKATKMLRADRALQKEFSGLSFGSQRTPFVFKERKNGIDWTEGFLEIYQRDDNKYQIAQKVFGIYLGKFS
jgi:hypothetical protein